MEITCTGLDLKLKSKHSSKFLLGVVASIFQPIRLPDVHSGIPCRWNHSGNSLGRQPNITSRQRLALDSVRSVFASWNEKAACCTAWKQTEFRWIIYIDHRSPK